MLIVKQGEVAAFIRFAPCAVSPPYPSPMCQRELASRATSTFALFTYLSIASKKLLLNIPSSHLLRSQTILLKFDLEL